MAVEERWWEEVEGGIDSSYTMSNWNRDHLSRSADQGRIVP